MSETKAKTCFIIMPISTPEAASLELYNGDADHFLHVLDCLFIPAIENSGLEPIPPVVAGSDLIHAQIVKNLSSADLVLCDMSQLNPNVFFEFGIRTALNKPVALITDEVSKNIPFDTGIINYHRYSSSLQGWVIKSEIQKLADHIRKTIESEPDRNSLWKYFGIAQTGFLSPEEGTPDDKLSLLIRKVDSIVVASQSPPVPPVLDPDVSLPYGDALREFQIAYLQKLLATGEDIPAVARRAGISRSFLYRLLKEFSPSKIEPDPPSNGQ